MKATPLCTWLFDETYAGATACFCVLVILLCEASGVDGIRHTIFFPLLLPLVLELEGVDTYLPLMEDCFDVEGRDLADSPEDVLGVCFVCTNI